MNQKAAGILLNSILTETEKGQSVFYLIEKFHDAGAGFAGGQFYKEWTALTKRYEEVEAKSIADLKKEYYSAKMEDEQQPSLFIVKMERLKIKMEEKGYKIDKDEFLRDILSKLPESKDSTSMNPYQIKKLFIKEKIGVGYKLDDLTVDLEKTYVENVEKRKEERENKSNTEGEKGFYSSGKPFKGKCNKCGKMGHMGKDCRGSDYKKKGPSKSDGTKKGFRNFRKFNGDCNHCGKPGHKKADCWQLHGKPGSRKGESANTARDKGEVAFICVPCDDEKLKTYSYKPVDNNIDDEGYPIPDSFFDSFGGESEPEADDDETAYYSAPEWHGEEEGSAHGTDAKESPEN